MQKWEYSAINLPMDTDRSASGEMLLILDHQGEKGFELVEAVVDEYHAEVILIFKRPKS
jgi:hypothetical protein